MRENQLGVVVTPKALGESEPGGKTGYEDTCIVGVGVTRYGTCVGLKQKNGLVI